MRKPASAANRALAIQRVRARLVRDSFPRIQMMLIVALTGGFGLLASFAMLQFGMESMAVRYPLALSCAYLFFLFLIWLWLRTNAEDYLEVPDITALVPRPGSSVGLPGIKSGGGGDFGGGGATGSFDVPSPALDVSTSSPLQSVGDSFGAAADADELAIPLMAIALAIGIALASFYIVYISGFLIPYLPRRRCVSLTMLSPLRIEFPGGLRNTRPDPEVTR